MKRAIYSKGDLVVMTAGAYSDMGVEAVVVALQDFTEPKRKRDRHPQALETAGLVRELSFRELWIGDR